MAEPAPCASRAVVSEYLDRLTNLRSDAADLIADDARWWVAGNWAGSGTFSKAEVASFGEASRRWFRGPLRLRVRMFLADGDKAMAELESDAVLANGQPYRNSYVMIYEVADGLITSVREHLDTELIAGALRDLGETHPARQSERPVPTG